jgi:hypothetical protein
VFQSAVGGMTRHAVSTASDTDKTPADGEMQEEKLADATYSAYRKQRRYSESMAKCALHRGGRSEPMTSLPTARQTEAEPPSITSSSRINANLTASSHSSLPSHVTTAVSVRLVKTGNGSAKLVGSDAQ